MTFSSPTLKHVVVTLLVISVSLVKDLRNSNKEIAGYGAATKSTIMLNYTKLGKNDLGYIVDSTPSKQGKYSPGMHVPVMSPNYFCCHYPDYAIIFPWNHFGEISEKEAAFQMEGGRWILPFLSPEVR